MSKSPVVGCHLLPFSRCPKNKNQELQTRFGLSRKEIVLGKYVCVLQKENTPLRKGRLFVFPNNLAFACDHFSMLLKLSEISRVKKAKALLIIPNSIEIRMVDEGTSHFFTTLLSRNKAYNQICDLWMIAKGIELAKMETRQEAYATSVTKTFDSNTTDYPSKNSRSCYKNRNQMSIQT